MNRFLTILIGFSLLTAGCQGLTDQVGWTQLHPESLPPVLHHGGIAYDTKHNHAIIFGGATDQTWSDQTWLWDGQNWQMETGATKPPPREKLAMAYDENRDVIVMFGGAMDKTLYNDTWEWSNGVWRQMKPAHGPSARCCLAMAYDGVQKKVILYGGVNGQTGVFYADSWEWDGNDWSEVTCCNAPLASAHSMVNFADVGWVISTPINNYGTWHWDGYHWGQVNAHPDPERADARSTYDSTYKRVILFGGSSKGTPLNDTWVFNGQNWQHAQLANNPPSRYGHFLFYDQVLKRVIVFGGAGTKGVLNDMWALNLPEDLSTLPVVPMPAPSPQAPSSN